MVYKFKEGARWGVDPNVAGSVCESLSSRGELTAEKLVDVSRDEEAPLHGCFTWDNNIAAEKYRNQEARCLIGSLEIVTVETNQTVRGFYHLNLEVERPSYEATEVIMNSVDKRTELLKIALSELKSFKKKYKTLTEMSKVFAAIDEIEEEVN